MFINGKKVSKLALGTAAYGNGLREKDAFYLMDVYRELGGNIFDTARVYGESENVMGRYLEARGCREKILISTKGAHYDVVTKEKRVNRKAIYSDIEMSLAKLKTDHADIYWLHRDDEGVPVSEIMGILADLTKEGKILSIGVSNWTHGRILEANEFAAENDMPLIIASQIKHSAAVTMFERDPTILSLDRDSAAFYEKEKMPIFAYTSQARGLFSKLEQFGVGGISEGLLREFVCNETLRRFDAICTVAKEVEVPVSRVALACVLCDSRLEMIPIIGSRTREQLEDSFAAIDISLTKEQFDKIMKG